MLKRLAAGSVVGGLILFAWGAFSWLVMPWHQNTLQTFDDEQAVARVLQANADSDGMYLLPNRYRQTPAGGAMQRGPFAFMSISLTAGDPHSPLPYLRGLLIQMLCAGLMTWLLMNARLPGYSCRLGFCVFIGLAAACLVLLPQWNWWQFSGAWLFVGFADLLIGSFLAGLALAGIAVRSD